jgi:hypothetical protein
MVHAQNADEIAARLAAHNAEREKMKLSVACDRVYRLSYRGLLGDKEATMNVHAVQDATGKKFTVTSESGSETLRHRVLHKALEAEQEAASGEIHTQSQIVPENYDFSLDSTEYLGAVPTYTLHIVPKRATKYVWKGRIWVDGADYAVVRAEGEPARMPSWWTTESRFDYRNQKVGPLWIPASNESETRIRFGGHAHLSIRYDGCTVTPTP